VDEKIHYLLTYFHVSLNIKAGSFCKFMGKWRGRLRDFMLPPRFRRDFALLACYVACSSSYRRLGTTNQAVWDCWALEDGTNQLFLYVVTSYLCTLQNISKRAKISFISGRKWRSLGLLDPWRSCPEMPVT